MSSFPQPPTIVLTTLESAGKSALFRVLTGQAARDESTLYPGLFYSGPSLMLDDLDCQCAVEAEETQESEVKDYAVHA